MKVAVVTGGSRGIGKSIAYDLATRGFFVLVNFRKNRDDAEKVVDFIRNEGGSAESYLADVSDAKQIEEMFEYVINKYKRIDVLINNAGLSNESFLMLQSLDKIEQLISTNLKSVILCCKAVTKCMISQKSGRIVNVSSVGAIKGSMGNAVYSATKSALSGFTRSLCKELGRYGITVNNVLPGMVSTDILNRQNKDFLLSVKKQIPLKRFAETKEVSSVVCFLASGDSSYVNGQDIVVDGGLSS